jgi:hypothetical protein
MDEGGAPEAVRIGAPVAETGGSGGGLHHATFALGLGGLTGGCSDDRYLGGEGDGQRRGREDRRLEKATGTVDGRGDADGS